MVLFLHGVANVDEFAVFENEKVVLLGELGKALGGLFAEVGENVDVCFEYGDVWTEPYIRKKKISRAQVQAQSSIDR